MMMMDKNRPILRFPEFEGEWEEKKLGEICNVSTGKRDTQDRINDGKYPFFVRSNTVERINEYTFNGEAILTSGDGVGVGKNFHYINGKFNYHQRVYCLNKFNKKVNGKYTYYYFSKAFFKRVMKLSAKNSVDSVRRSMITEMLIPLTSLPEQQKIADFLSKIDECIHLLKEKKETLKTYKKGLMQKLFNQEIRFPEFEREWESVTIDKVLKIGNGKSYKHLKKGSVPVYGTGGYMTSVNGYLFDGESVCIGRKGTINKPLFLLGKFWTVDTLFYTHSFTKVLPLFIYFVFLRINWKKYNEASGVPSLSKSTISKIPITIPSIPEQEKIANFLSTIDTKIDLVQQQIEQTQQFKKGLLQQMFV